MTTNSQETQDWINQRDAADAVARARKSVFDLLYVQDAFADNSAVEDILSKLDEALSMFPSLGPVPAGTVFPN